MHADCQHAAIRPAVATSLFMEEFLFQIYVTHFGHATVTQPTVFTVLVKHNLLITDQKQLAVAKLLLREAMDNAIM